MVFGNVVRPPDQCPFCNIARVSDFVEWHAPSGVAVFACDNMYQPHEVELPVPAGKKVGYPNWLKDRASQVWDPRGG